MKKIAILTDSACDLPDSIIEKYNIKLLPLRIIYHDREYRDRVEIKPKEVYDNIEKEVPKTSLPVPEDILSAFDSLADEGYTDAVVITISSNLSGTFNLIKLLAKDYERLNIKVYDSKTLGIFLGFIVKEAAVIAHTQKNMEDVIDRAKEIRDKLKGCYVLKTLTYLRKGGRIGKVEGTVGEFFNIKPIIGINDEGVYFTIAKVRGRRKSISKIKSMIMEEFKDKKYNIAIIHGGAEEEAKQLYNSIKNIGNIIEGHISQISPALGVHTGPGLIGYVAYEV
ncbi:DegV family protein [Vallitalea sp.]|jgi:DegV family protein with EDD domain|uniref:DegV family protein n=1 Tax=Vallitalea sp. TaxID=1882829 RepID=UPI0025E9DE8C|nr:DegV family protein [Vallitalea sp.]MCT4687793.1 DegV family protein [Vallitalea sp.]